MYIIAFLRYSLGVYTADWSIIGDTVWLYMSINIIGQSKTINNSNLVVEVEMISPVRWDGSLSAGISPALEVNQIFFLVIFGILRFIYFWRCVFLELQWNLSAFWHFTSLKVCQIFFLMTYSNSFFVDRICIFEWQWNLRRVFFLFLVCFNGMWWRGRESW